MTDALWQLGGWTMIHFLWLGTAVALLGGALRFACRRAALGARYSASLMTLAVLAATPIAIATWLAINADVTPLLQPQALPGGSTTVEHDPTSTPGQRPGLQNAAPPVVIDLAHTAPLPQQILPLPSPRRGGVGGGVSSADDVAISASTITVATVVAALPWLWLIGAPLTFALLASGLVGSERLRRKCTALTDGPAATACEQLRQAMRITRRVSVAVCDHLAQPVLIGILRPLILLPASALSGWTPAELEMVLVHELAHVRRWDNLVNLLQRIIESALFFHPAVWLISRQVRRDREECCDAVVVSRIERPHDYAALLVSIASKMQSRRPAALAAASAMADHPLTGRVRRILKLEDEPMWISRRTLGLTLALPLLLVGAVLYTAAAAEEENPPPLKGGARGGIEPENPPPLSDRVDPTQQAVIYTIKPAAVKAMQPYVAENARRLGLWGYDWAGDYGSITITSNEKNQAQFREIISQKGWLEHAQVVHRQLAAEFVDPEIELPRLMHEIKRLEDQIAEANKDLVNIEIFKQLALQSPRSSAEVEKAVAEVLEKDPMIAEYQQQLSKLQEAIQQRQTTTRNPNDLQLRKLTQQFDQLQQRMQQHRVLIEKSAREQIVKQMPNEAYRAAIVEHKIRYEAATANLKKYQEELREADRKLAELTPTSSGPDDESDQVYAVVYPIADLETIDFQQWMRLISSDERIDVRWYEKNKSLVVNAPLSGHQQIADLFRETRRKSGDPGFEEQIGEATKRSTGDRRTAPLTAPQQEINWRNSLDDAKQEALQTGKPLLIYFHAKSSVPCQTFEQTTLLNSDVRSYIDDKFIAMKIDVDASPAVTAEFRIQQVPRTVVATSRGKALAQMGANKPAFFLTSLVEVSDKEHLAPNATVVVPDDGTVLIGQLKSTKPAEPTAPNPLSPGDEVRIQAIGAFPEWPLHDVFRIEEEGTLALGPPYGRVSVVGQTVAEAEKTVQAHLAKTLTDVEVQLTLHQRASNSPQNPGDGNATYLYDGKPFDEWRNLWKHELNTERRTEAIEALAAFARAGYGKEAAETILDVAAEYDFKSYDDSPEGKLRECVAQVLTLGRASRVPATDWLPALMDRLTKDPDKWRPLMARLMSGGVPETDYTLDPATRKLLLQMASDPKQGPNAAALTALYYRSPTGKGDPAVAPLIKAALAGEDVANALAVLKTLGFGSIDDWPEQLDFLFHQDAAARRTARTILRGAFPQSRQTVAERLEAVLDDPKRAEDHADAIRALGVLARPLNNRLGGRREGWPDEATIKELNKRFERITREGPPELVAPALVAMGIDGVETIDGAIKQGMSGESEEYKERIKQAREKIEAEVEQLVDPPHFGGMGGGGMGGAGTGGSGGGIF